jgi:hypothetical protein
MQNYLYDPRGKIENVFGQTAQRVSRLDKLRLGVLNNTKWNAAKLLHEIVALLNIEVTFSEINYFKKETYTRVAAPDLLDTIAKRSDIVLIAIAD